MSKPLLNADSVKRPVPCRTSKSDEVCRNLLYYFANKIGPRTQELIQTLHHGEISESDCRILDDIITIGVFSDQEIENAARAALQNVEYLFGSFLTAILWGK